MAAPISSSSLSGMQQNVASGFEVGSSPGGSEPTVSLARKRPRETKVALESLAKRARTSPAPQKVDTSNKIGGTEASSLPSISDLVQDYKTRGWIEKYEFGIGPMSGYRSKGATQSERILSHEKEKELLLDILKKYLTLNKDFINQINSRGVGVIEKVLLNNRNTIFIRGDLHSDLRTLIETLEFFKQNGLLDGDYRCKEGFHIVFDGDYTDRGMNDIEVLTLLLLLKMANPSSVHLVRGNHESYVTQASYSFEGRWFCSNAKDFEECYKTFPEALCMAEQGGRDGDGKEREYVFISHGGINPFVDLADLFDTDQQYLFVDKETNAQLFANKIRARLESSSSVSSTAGKEKINKKKIALEWLLSHIPVMDTVDAGYLWGSLADTTQPSHRGAVGAFDLTAEDLHQYGRVAGGRSKIKHFSRAHTHTKKQKTVSCKPSQKTGVVKRTEKVMVTTMPTARKGGMYGKALGPEPVQGLYLKVAPRVKDWSGEVLLMPEGKSPEFGLPFTSLYERIFT